MSVNTGERYKEPSLNLKEILYGIMDSKDDFVFFVLFDDKLSQKPNLRVYRKM